MFETELKKPVTFIKLGSLREKYILKVARQEYDGIFVSASTIETFRSSVPSFIRGLDKPFVIDPMTYVFALPLRSIMASKDSKIKRAFVEMSIRYGTIVQREIGKSAINWQDFQNAPEIVEELTKNVLSYQLERLKRPPSFADYYSEFELLLPEVEPEILIPPYFYFRDIHDPWYTVTLKFARKALDIKQKNWKVFPVIIIPRQLLEKRDEVETLVSDYISDNYDGFFIWVNNFKEEDANFKQLKGLVELVTALTSSRKPVLKLYGGYFSALLWYAGLAGFSFGLGYGSSKNAFAYRKTKSAPNPLYYVHELHRFLTLPKAEDFLKRYPNLMCNCPTCKAFINADHLNLSCMRDINRAAQHFLNVRLNELSELSKAQVTSVSTGLEQSIQDFDLRLLSAINIDNLRNWRRVLLALKVPTMA
jgi:hypothetical protein